MRVILVSLVTALSLAAIQADAAPSRDGKGKFAKCGMPGAKPV